MLGGIEIKKGEIFILKSKIVVSIISGLFILISTLIPVGNRNEKMVSVKQGSVLKNAHVENMAIKTLETEPDAEILEEVEESTTKESVTEATTEELTTKEIVSASSKVEEKVAESTTKTEETTKKEISTTEKTTEKPKETTTKAERATANKSALIGNFKITGYTAEEGFYYGKQTASYDTHGYTCKPGICAMNSQRRRDLGLNYGDQIYIEGLGTYTVADCGCNYNVVDIWVYTNSEAAQITGYHNVYYT